jgi:hypothetical protein
MVTKKPKTKSPKIRCCSFNMEEKGCGGFAYFLGFIGAAIYYVSQASGVIGGIVGVIKGIFWPAFLVHALLKFIGA